MTAEESIKLLQAAKLMLLGKDNQPVSDLYFAIEEAIDALQYLQDRGKNANVG